MSRLNESQVPLAINIAMGSGMGVAGKLGVIFEAEGDMPAQGFWLMYASLTGTGVLVGSASRNTSKD